MKKIILFMCLLVPSALSAQAIQEGYISKLFVSNDLTGKVDSQRVIIRIDNKDVEGGLCPKKVYWQMLLNTHAEKAQYDLLLASYLHNKKVKVWGNKSTQCIHKGERVRNVEIAY